MVNIMSTPPASPFAGSRIAKVDHWLIRMPLKESILWGSGARTGTTRLVVRIETGDGIVGWGETLCLLDAIPAVFRAIVAPLAIGADIADAERMHRHVLGAGYYHHKRAAVMAICALEMAMWDALGRRAGLPLHALWGGRWRDRVLASAYVFVSDPAKVSETARRFLDQGFRSFKIKIGVTRESDITLVEAMRAAIGDCESGPMSTGPGRREPRSGSSSG